MTNQIQNSKNKTFSTIGEVIQEFKKGGEKNNLPSEFSRDKYISREFQKYAYDLAKELDDLAHKSLYMRLAKNTPRALLENARNFVKEASSVNSRARLFMWKLSELKKARK